MFEKRETRFLANARREGLWSKSWDWWSRQGFQLAQTGAFRFHGASSYSRIGLRREVDLAVDEVPGGCKVDLTVHAQLTDEGVVAGAVTAVFLFPVAVLGGAVSYTEYETDARNLMLAFWQFLSTDSGGTSAVDMPAPCSACGRALLPDWRACPYCGKGREAEA